MATATTPTAPTPKKARTPKAPTPAGLIEIKAAQRAAMLLKNLGDAGRIQFLCLLADGPMNVTEMCAALDRSQPGLSHHLAMCRHGGIIESRRQGKSNFYSLTAKGRLMAETARRLIAEDAGR